MTGIVWPHALLTEVAERRAVIVIGAGASATATAPDGSRPPGWKAFLQDGIGRLSSDEDKAEALRLLEQNAVLDAAQIMADGLGPGDFAMFIREALERPGFRASELHEQIVSIDPKIVVSMNYDTIYESLATQGAAAAGYNVCRYYEDHLINDLRSDRRLILKAHGCVSNPQKVVLTRKQYFEARRTHPQYFSALDAIVLTSTLLFIGIGFNGDPDIELLLQNANIAAPSEHPHYALVEAGRHPSVLRALALTHNISFIEYENGHHEQAIEALTQLADDVAAYRSVNGP